MTYQPHPKHVRINPNNPEPLGVCDKTGLVFMRKDLVKQMEWRGQSLAWTGKYVGRPYLDTPNPQGASPDLVPDPVPVAEPRPPLPDVDAPTNEVIQEELDNQKFVSGYLQNTQNYPTNEQILESLNNTWFISNGQYSE